MGCQTRLAPKYKGPLPAFYICDDSILCIREEAAEAWTAYYLRLQSWAEDTNHLCVREDEK